MSAVMVGAVVAYVLMLVVCVVAIAKAPNDPADELDVHADDAIDLTGGQR